MIAFVNIFEGNSRSHRARSSFNFSRQPDIEESKGNVANDGLAVTRQLSQFAVDFCIYV